MDKLMAFQGQVFGGFCATMTAFGAYLGDRLNLFASLARSGPLEAAELSEKLKLDFALVQQWLQLMTAAGYLDFDPETETYALDPEHAAVIGKETGPMSVAGGFQQLGAFAAQLPALVEAFRAGGGLRQESYSEDLWAGMERLSAMWFDHEMVEAWVPSVAGLEAKLKKGARVADIGSGSGRALIRLAQAFPKSRFVGYDSFPAAVDRARRNAELAGVVDNVNFLVHDTEAGLPETFDLVTAFDSLHDMSDLAAAISGVGSALNPDGVFLIFEFADPSERAAGEHLPTDVMLHGVNLFYNLPVALSVNPAKTDPVALPESRLRRLCSKAGLSLAKSAPTRNPIHVMYEARPRGI
jgi:SAM-dependent methyltransferase